MRLLFVTQVVDRNDGVLGAYHEWIERLAAKFERIEVICLYAGDYSLPPNVTVHSLGKERGRVSRMTYSCRFLRKAWALRREHDAVFVHMNQEYLPLAGALWKLLGKRMYFWRNHYAGSLLTDMAASFCTKVFCTSKHSYTARYKKTVLMPVGVDTERFVQDTGAERKERSILFLARMAPSKNPELLIDALHLLAQKGVPFTATFIGSPIPEYQSYYRSLTDKAETYGLSERVVFRPAVPNRETPHEYRTHELFVNCSPSGMFDKTIFEAAACGATALAVSADYRELAGSTYGFTSAEELAKRLEAFLSRSAEDRMQDQEHMRRLAEDQSLIGLIEKLAILMSCPTSS